MRIALAALLPVILCCSAHAGLPAAQSAYDAGAYERAAQQGETVGTAASLTLASQALLAECLAQACPGAADRLARAVQDAQQALALNRDSVDARLELALAFGMQGQHVSLGEAWRRGYAQRGRRLIEQALALSPEDARALALLGAWHLEVLRRAGGAGAFFLGASYRRGVAAFDRARAAAPNDPVIALHYAVALLALDPRKHAAQAADLLDAAALSPAGDAFESAMREDARRLGAVLASEGAQAAANLVNRRFL